MYIHIGSTVNPIYKYKYTSIWFFICILVCIAPRPRWGPRLRSGRPPNRPNKKNYTYKYIGLTRHRVNPGLCKSI